MIPKRSVCVLGLSAALLMTGAMAAETATAYGRTQIIKIDKETKNFHTFALKDESGAETNYVKLRDLAYALNGTKCQFAVGYDGAIQLSSETAYATIGTEMAETFQGDQTCNLTAPVTLLDGEAVEVDAILLTDAAGGGHTYYQLRQLGDLLGFTVDWSEETGITLTTPQDSVKLSNSNALGLHYAGFF